MSPWHHPLSYPVWAPDDPIRPILDEIVDEEYRMRRKVVYLETGTGLAAVYECDRDYTPRAVRRLRRGTPLLYLCRRASERRDVMRYAVLLSEDHGGMPLEVSGPRKLMPELRRERSAVMLERAEHVRTARDDGWGIDMPEAVLP